MSKELRKHSFDRITIAFCAPGAEEYSVDAATTLAMGFGAEVSGVFIEDIEMLRAAKLPIALELCRVTNLIRPVNSSEIEHALKHSASEAQRVVSETAERIGIKWTFDTVRKHIARTILELAQGTDVTVYTIDTPEARRARSIAASPSMATLRRDTIVVFVDRSAAAARALTVSQKLSETLSIPITALVIAATTAGSEQISKRIERRDDLLTTQIRRFYRATFDELVNAARSHQPSVVVLPISLLDGLYHRVEELENTLARSIVIVR